MQISFLGATLHEFDVGITDVILFLLCSWFLYQLIKSKAKRDSLLIFSGLAASSLFGALFHFFFPLKATTAGGFFVWTLVAVSIGLVIYGAISYSLKALSLFDENKYKLVPVVYTGVFFIYFFLVSHTFPSIILFYGPSVLFLGIVALIKIIKRNNLYWYLLGGVFLSFLAAVVQITHVNIHPVYFNFNSLYHSIQLVGIFYLYFFFKKDK